ncbi:MULTISPECIES: PIN domain-containing protein [unclassified Streptomyces]|uniref:hypothetical protein n=1 Tax=unclassified Streptomyces TaxID=2593676 RepID=UPI0036B46217
MIDHHLVLDTGALLALAGNRQVSVLIHRARFEPAARLWVPVLSLWEAEKEMPGLTEHVGQLDVLHTVDFDYPAGLTVARLGQEGVSAGIAAAIHAARNLPEWGADSLVATFEPKAYEDRGVVVFDLNR